MYVNSLWCEHFLVWIKKNLVTKWTRAPGFNNINTVRLFTWSLSFTFHWNCILVATGCEETFWSFCHLFFGRVFVGGVFFLGNGILPVGPSFFILSSLSEFVVSAIVTFERVIFFRWWTSTSPSSLVLCFRALPLCETVWNRTGFQKEELGSPDIVLRAISFEKHFVLLGVVLFI